MPLPGTDDGLHEVAGPREQVEGRRALFFDVACGAGDLGVGVGIRRAIGVEQRVAGGVGHLRLRRVAEHQELGNEALDGGGEQRVVVEDRERRSGDAPQAAAGRRRRTGQWPLESNVIVLASTLLQWGRPSSSPGTIVEGFPLSSPARNGTLGS